jgi:hypothetical protein
VVEDTACSVAAVAAAVAVDVLEGTMLHTAVAIYQQSQHFSFAE